jgi:beta-glucosidase
MPGPARVMGEDLLRAVVAGEVSEDVLDDKVRRLLRLSLRTGRLDHPQEQPEAADDRPEHRDLARRAAVESMVLVKNEGVLPLVPGSLTKLAVIGPNAAVGMIQGGGSSRVEPHYESHPLAALQQRLEPDVEVLYASGGRIDRYLPAVDKQQLRPASGEMRAGLTLEYWNGRAIDGPSVESRVVGRCRSTWYGRFSDHVDPSDFCARYSGLYTPTETGLHSFGLVSSGASRLWIDDELVIDCWEIDEDEISYFGQLLPEQRGQRPLEGGEPVRLRVEFRSRLGPGQASVRFGVQPPTDEDPIGLAVATAAEADAALLIVGSSAEYETEGRDRDDMTLPGQQVELIERVVAANPNTAVVLNCGSPVLLDWLERVPALLQVWFPGQEFGNALADVLLGDEDASGRMTTSWPARLQDTPSFASYPGCEGKVEYSEGVYVGYRWYDEHGIAPAVPFGHGLSYTRFDYGPLQLPATLRAPDALKLSLEVTNTGERAGHEVVQLYLSAPGSSLACPDQELRALCKVRLEPGETQRVRFRLDRRDLSHWDPQAREWIAEPGRYEIRVGASSRDIRRRANVALALA